MKKYKWYGFKIVHEGGEESLHIGNLPGRKRVCLYRTQGGVLESLAYFDTEAKAYDALRMISILAGARHP
jgi:hypothetical protein